MTQVFPINGRRIAFVRIIAGMIGPSEDIQANNVTMVIQPQVMIYGGRDVYVQDGQYGIVQVTK